MIFNNTFDSITIMSIDWTRLYKKHKGLWVALKNDEKTVIASGKTAKETFQKAISKGYKDPILTNLPQELTPYVG